MTSIGYWNIRGIRKKNLWQDLAYIRQQNKLDILVLAETKTFDPPVQALYQKAGFHLANHIPSIGTKGGMWILIKNSCFSNTIKELGNFDNYIIYSVKLQNFKFIIIFIYAPSNPLYKQLFWNEIIAQIQRLSLPVMIIGDFNEISIPADKIGGIIPQSNRFKQIQQITDELGLHSLPFKGSPITWRKRQSSINNIYERLDRVMIHPDISSRFCDMNVVNHPFTASDHSLIFVAIGVNKAKLGSPFRFEMAWCLKDNYKKIVDST